MSNANIPGPLTVYRRRAMASDFEVSFNENTTENGADAALTALDEVDRFESILSVFRPQSDVSRLNLLGAEMNIRVCPELLHALLLCRTLWEETDGAFDITASPLWELWGFARKEGNVPLPEKIAETLLHVGMQHVNIREDLSVVTFDHPDVKISFGGIGKGLALDAATELMERTGAANFLIHGGKSSVVARGGRSGDYCDSGKNRRTCWTIGLASPKQPDQRLAEIHLRNTSLATSGSQYQFFRYRGQRLAHILNPQTGLPAQGLLSTTVIATSAAITDALSTAFFILGIEGTQKYCDKHPEVTAILLKEAKTIKGYEIVSFNANTNVVQFL